MRSRLAPPASPPLPPPSSPTRRSADLLRARPYNGIGTIRTGLHGWYLRRDRSIAVDTEARYLVMRVDGGLRARLRGAAPEASYAPLVVGRGARDGETFDLDELLHMRLQDPVRPWAPPPP